MSLYAVMWKTICERLVIHNGYDQNSFKKKDTACLQEGTNKAIPKIKST